MNYTLHCYKQSFNNFWISWQTTRSSKTKQTNKRAYNHSQPKLNYLHIAQHVRSFDISSFNQQIHKGKLLGRWSLLLLERTIPVQLKRHGEGTVRSSVTAEVNVVAALLRNLLKLALGTGSTTETLQTPDDTQHSNEGNLSNLLTKSGGGTLAVVDI